MSIVCFAEMKTMSNVRTILLLYSRIFSKSIVLSNSICGQVNLSYKIDRSIVKNNDHRLRREMSFER